MSPRLLSFVCFALVGACKKDPPVPTFHADAGALVLPAVASSVVPAAASVDASAPSDAGLAAVAVAVDAGAQGPEPGGNPNRARPAVDLGKEIAIPSEEDVPARGKAKLEYFAGGTFAAAGYRVRPADAGAPHAWTFLDSKGKTCTGTSHGRAVLVLSPLGDLAAPPEPTSKEQSLDVWFDGYPGERTLYELVRASCQPFVAVPTGTPAPALLSTTPSPDGAAVKLALGAEAGGPGTVLSALELGDSGLVYVWKHDDSPDVGTGFVLTRKGKGFGGSPLQVQPVKSWQVTREAPFGGRPGRVLVWGSASYAIAMADGEPGEALSIALHGSYE